VHIQYVGFSVAASSRTYRYDVLDLKERRAFTVQVQSEAFRPAGLKLQAPCPKEGRAPCWPASAS